ncbi:MAG: prephenate/arogenate dehydrogenase family protein [Neomegalonema sp.]|nr:prephenate/arogenate dehydrogenase family protein [Neomegalonema sp.]
MTDAAPAPRWRRLDKPLFEKAALIGLGLLGSSVARAIRRSGAAATIVGAEPNDAHRADAEKLGFCDAVVASGAEAVIDADFVCICAPVGAAAAIGAEIGPALAPGAILSDVGSVKGAVIKALAPHVREDICFVPAHPIAGTERSGPDAGFAELFENRWCIITPTEGSPPEAVAKVAALWRAFGSDVDEMTPSHHDRVVAVVSHLPHLIAYTIVGTASDLEEVTQSEVIKFSAAGFRDFTRIAASDPVMWRDIFLTNKEAVLELLGRFTEDLVRLQRAIRWGEGDTLHEHFTHTRAIRRGIIEQGQDTAAPDFGRRASPDPAIKAEPDE